MELGPVRDRFEVRVRGDASVDEGSRQRNIIPERVERPSLNTQLGRPVEVIGYGAGRDVQAEGNLPMSQLSLLFKAKNVFEVSHSDRPRRHALSSVVTG